MIFTTDNGAEVFTWPDGGMTPFKATKGTSFEGGFRVPCIIRWPGKIKPGTVGGPTQFQAYLQLRLANKLANENLEAAQMNQDASMEWAGWCGWGGVGWGRFR